MTPTSPPPAPAGDALENSLGNASERSVRSRGRRASVWLRNHPKASLGLLLAGPVIWLVAAYLGSLGALLMRALFQQDELSGNLIRDPTFANFEKVLTGALYRDTTIRTVLIALAVTLIDLLVAIPIALFMAKVARPKLRKILVVAVLMPLWASYVVKAYAWRTLLDPEGGVLHERFGISSGFGVAATIVTLAYLWLPYMILPVYSGLERVPDSLLEAASDLGAKTPTVLRSVVLPMLTPSILAGSIFTFSLTLGDYIAVQYVGGTSQTLGLVIYKFAIGGSQVTAAAFAFVPVVVMAIYLAVVRKSGALENL
jgi:putative spermidine/putrescine transport system permease protein